MTKYIGCDHILGEGEEEVDTMCPVCSTLYEAGRIVFVEQLMAAYPDESQDFFSALYDECVAMMLVRLREANDVPVQSVQEGGDTTEYRGRIDLP